MSRNDLPLRLVPCSNCDGQGWYWLASKNPDGSPRKATCEACGGEGTQFSSLPEEGDRNA